MKTELSAAKLYHQHFLQIVQYNDKPKMLPVPVIKIDESCEEPPLLPPALITPADWEVSWFANYE